MSRSKKSLLFGLALIPLMAGGFVFQQRDSQQGARLLDQVLNIVSTRFVDTVDAATLYEKAARGLVKGRGIDSDDEACGDDVEDLVEKASALLAIALLKYEAAGHQRNQSQAEEKAFLGS